MIAASRLNHQWGNAQRIAQQNASAIELDFFGRNLADRRPIPDLKFKRAMQALEKEALDVQGENTKLREENTKLRELLNARAEMKPFGPLNYFYKNGQTDGPYCPTCWQRDEKQVLLPASAKYAGGTGKLCTVCKELYIEQAAPPIGPAIALYRRRQDQDTDRSPLRFTRKSGPFCFQSNFGPIQEGDKWRVLL